MATQFAINEPDSSNSPNAAYLQLRGSRAQGFRLLHSPDDVVFGYGAIDFIGDHDYFDIPLPSNIIDSFLIFSGTVTINVIANDGTPFDGVLTLYPRFNSSDVVATGTSLGAGETFLQFNGGSSYSGYSLELQDNGNDQTGGYTIFVNVPGGPPLYADWWQRHRHRALTVATCWSG